MIIQLVQSCEAVVCPAVVLLGNIQELHYVFDLII